MSSPSTVNDLMQWLNKLFGFRLPLLPLTGFPQAMKDLWRAAVGFIPNPKSPLPWRVPVADDIPIPGTHGKIENIEIVVSDKGSPSSRHLR